MLHPKTETCIGSIQALHSGTALAVGTRGLRIFYLLILVTATLVMARHKEVVNEGSSQYANVNDYTYLSTGRFRLISSLVNRP